MTGQSSRYDSGGGDTSFPAGEATLSRGTGHLPQADQAFFAAACQSSEDGIIGLSPDFTIRTWNAGAEKLYGYNAEKVVGKPFALLVPEDMRGEHAHWREALKSDGHSITTDAVRRRIDGSPVEVSVRISTVRDASGVLVGYCSIARDISDLKKASTALRESEARYRTLVAATAQIVWINTPRGEMTGANAAWGAYTGQTEQEYQGYGWAAAVHPDDAEPTIAAWQKAVAARETFLFEHRLRRHDGVYRTFAIRAVPVRENNDAIREWVGVHSDITERKSLEATRESVVAKQQAFLRDVLASVTEGHLILCATPQDLPAPLTPLGPPIMLTKTEGLWKLRQTALAAGRAQGLSEVRCYDLVTAVSEAGMNAVVHAGAGIGQVFADTHTSTIQVWVIDQGAGIALENIPQATLKQGFTTAGTLGHGMKMMLQTADHTYLLTGSGGTTVVVEQQRALPV